MRRLPSFPAQIELIIVGRMDGVYADEVRAAIERRGLAGRVRHLQNVPLPTSPRSTLCAVASAYTSRYEGFGIPVAESLYRRHPVVACTAPALKRPAAATVASMSTPTMWMPARRPLSVLPTMWYGTMSWQDVAAAMCAASRPKRLPRLLWPATRKL